MTSDPLPKPTPLAVARAEIRRLSERVTLYELALGAMADTPPAASEQFGFDKGQYVFRLFRPLAPHGGIVTITYRRRGQRSLVSVGYLERLTEEYRTVSGDVDVLPFRMALQRLTSARNRLVVAETDRVNRITPFEKSSEV